MWKEEKKRSKAIYMYRVVICYWWNIEADVSKYLIFRSFIFSSSMFCSLSCHIQFYAIFALIFTDCTHCIYNLDYDYTLNAWMEEVIVDVAHKITHKHIRDTHTPAITSRRHTDFQWDDFIFWESIDWKITTQTKYHLRDRKSLRNVYAKFKRNEAAYQFCKRDIV